MKLEIIRERLTKLYTQDDLIELFGDFGYSYPQNTGVYTDDWRISVQQKLDEYNVTPEIIADRENFVVIFCQLENDKLLRTVMRPIINQIRVKYDYFMVIFRNNATSKSDVEWSFANVRVMSDEEDRIRRIVRYINIGASERIENRLYTASRRLEMIDIIADPHITPAALQNKHDKAFDVEEVTRDFYQQYVDVFSKFVNDIAENNANRQQDVQDLTLTLLDRLMFLYFIQKKGWLNDEQDYLFRRFQNGDYADMPEDSSYYTKVIYPLFEKMADGGKHDLWLDSIGYVPFLNGGLFQLEPKGMEASLKVSNQVFAYAFRTLFEKYAFTVEEDMPDDRVVAIDPEMLGKVFESLVLNLEQDEDLRHATGSYYTPRNIVSFMSRQSILEYLVQKWSENFSQESPDGMLPMSMPLKDGQMEFRDVELNYPVRIDRFVQEGNAKLFDHDKATAMRDWLLNIRVVDPAVGSGAFLVGLLNEIVRLVKILDEYTDYTRTERYNYDYQLKREIVSKCLYGVDVQAQAVRICELRLWLALVVDFQPRNADDDISIWIRDVTPLPNLSYLVREGDSLIQTVMGEIIPISSSGLRHEAGREVDALQEAKSKFFDATNIDDKRRYRQIILIEQSRLMGKLLDHQIEIVRSEIHPLRPSNELFGDIESRDSTFSKQEQKRLNMLIEQKKHLEDLVQQAYSIRKQAEELRISSGDTFDIELQKLSDSLSRGKAGDADKPSFIWQVDFGEIFFSRNGFDVVIANPPYIRQEQIRGLKPNLEKLLPQVYSGTADLYVYFYAQALDLLRKGGVMTFISPNKFMRTKYGEKLRAYLRNQTIIRTLIDFGDLPIFDATTYPLIVIIKKPNAQVGKPNNDIRFLNVQDMAQVRMIEQVMNTADTTPQMGLRDDAWQLIDKKTFDLLNKLEKQQNLEDYTNQGFLYGIKTGFSAGFVIDELTFGELISDGLSHQVIKKWIRGRGISSWNVNWQGEYVIAIQNSGDADANHPWENAETEAEARKIFKETYPNVHDYLMQYEDHLRKRYDQGRYWWELRACTYYSKLEAPKILYQRFQVTPKFTLDEDNFYMNDSVFALSNADKFLLGCLNSSLGWFQIGIYCHQIRNGFQLLWDNFKQVRIPDAPDNLRQQIETLVQRLLDLEGKGADVPALEAQLNQLVYQAYGLADDEIRLIERQIGIEATQVATNALQKLKNMDKS